MPTKYLVLNLKIRDISENVSVNARIILKNLYIERVRRHFE
jgi:hypothetical protein